MVMAKSQGAHFAQGTNRKRGLGGWGRGGGTGAGGNGRSGGDGWQPSPQTGPATATGWWAKGPPRGENPDKEPCRKTLDQYKRAGKLALTEVKDRYIDLNPGCIVGNVVAEWGQFLTAIMGRLQRINGCSKKGAASDPAPAGGIKFEWCKKMGHFVTPKIYYEMLCHVIDPPAFLYDAPCVYYLSHPLGCTRGGDCPYPHLKTGYNLARKGAVYEFKSHPSMGEMGVYIKKKWEDDECRLDEILEGLTKGDGHLGPCQMHMAIPAIMSYAILSVIYHVLVPNPEHTPPQEGRLWAKAIAELCPLEGNKVVSYMGCGIIEAKRTREATFPEEAGDGLDAAFASACSHLMEPLLQLEGVDHPDVARETLKAIAQL